MHTAEKFFVSLAWVAISFAATLALGRLRNIGTTWTDNPGFLRMIGLGLFILVFMLGPLILAVLVWAGKPRRLYKNM